MKRLAIIIAIAIVSLLGHAFAIDTSEAGVSDTVFGAPAVCLGAQDLPRPESGEFVDRLLRRPCWLVVGGGTGAVVLGAGFGLVVFAIYGVGVFFATGQLALGGIAFGQVGAGLSFFVGQAGGAFVAYGQVVGGAISAGQASLGYDGSEFGEVMGENLQAALGPRPVIDD